MRHLIYRFTSNKNIGAAFELDSAIIGNLLEDSVLERAVSCILDVKSIEKSLPHNGNEHWQNDQKAEIKLHFRAISLSSEDNESRFSKYTSLCARTRIKQKSIYFQLLFIKAKFSTKLLCR